MSSLPLPGSTKSEPMCTLEGAPVAMGLLTLIIFCFYFPGASTSNSIERCKQTIPLRCQLVMGVLIVIVYSVQCFR